MLRVVASHFSTMGQPGKSISQALKVLIIAMYILQAKSKAEIARELHVSDNTVFRWIERWEETESIDRKSGQGRKPAMNAKACRYALQLLVARHMGAHAAACELHSRRYTKDIVSATTLIKHVKAFAKMKGTPITCKHVKLRKRLSDDNKKRRRSFCCTHSNSLFANVMFTDRCKFAFKHPGEVVQSGVWHFVGQANSAFTSTHPDVFNVYGGITMYGTTRLKAVTGSTSFHPITRYTTKNGKPSKNITCHEYYDVLMKGLLPDGHALFKGQDWVLQQDNDPTHKSASEKAVRDWNQSLHDRGIEHGRVTIMSNWPPNSPDLSIIENCWAIIQSRVAARGCDTLAEFQAAVQDIFSNIDPKPLFESIPARLRQCLEANGDRTAH